MSHSPEHSAASLYCPEEAADLVSSDGWISDPQTSSDHHSSPPDESAIARLIESEAHHLPRPDYLTRCRNRSIDLTARQDSINWILRVHAHYCFKPVTAYLSVSYFDRVLSSHSLPQGNGWPFQLLSVACLSLAAKMEELCVPLLLDLQVFQPRFVFEPRTVQRMELWVLAHLNWRVRSVTPFDFLPYFISKLPSFRSKPEDLTLRLLSASSSLVLNTILVIDFLGFRPSTIAAAAVLLAAGENVDFPVTYYDIANEEMVRSCRQLMEEYLVDTCPSADHKGRRRESSPQPPTSPVAVLDAAACGSCDTRSEIPVSVSGSASSQLEPPNKRPRSSASSDVQQKP